MLDNRNIENAATQKYRDYLETKKLDLIFKALFDRLLAVVLLVMLSPVFLVLFIWIKVDSSGPVFFRQVRVTQSGRLFRIFKFRTMVVDADKKGSLVTIGEDSRITTVGRFIRKYRLDELPQLLNVIQGDMSFVGVRPEVEKYVSQYNDEMLATLLMPAGITSPASIAYKSEDELMEKYVAEGMSPDQAYVTKILPDKMIYNLDYISHFSFWGDLKIMLQTVYSVLK